ncbi:MAG TPA: iron-containing alcohol dehydrogenase [Rectinemataceae bacterium]|nr:iron-containing alcohol dehydrogenase [Rectinemataceae bacterium]
MDKGSYFEFHNPVKILAGAAALERLPSELERLGCSRPMLVTDKGVRGAGLVDIVMRAAGESALVFGAIFDEVPPDSGTATVAAAARVYRAKACDGIVAVGGGSSIDTAKALNVLVSRGGEDLKAYSGAGAITGRLGPFVVVPTTAGTGSECTLVAVIREDTPDRGDAPDRGAVPGSGDAAGRKLLFVSPSLLPDAAILDARMTLSLPPIVTAATGMDALTHAVEASYCLGKNPLSDAYASQAVSLIASSLVGAVRRPADVPLRLDLALASTMAGIAFSNSMVGLVHSLGHATGAVCHVPHGVAMGVFLPAVLEYNLGRRADAIGELYLPFAGVEAYRAVAAAERPRAFIDAVVGLRRELHDLTGLPRSLSETGKVDRSALPLIARAAIDDASMAYNPEEASLADCLSLLESCY